MPIKRIETYNFRNLDDASLGLSDGINIISGNNGSGKTSILEAINVTCCARSFLGASPRKFLQLEKNSLALRAFISTENSFDTQISFKWLDSSTVLSIGNERISRASLYAQQQPVQAITPISFQVIDQAPELRRKFIDWGVFHVKHEYASLWQNFQRVLLQRNKAIADSVHSDLDSWNNQFVKLSLSITSSRQHYTDQFIEIFDSVLRQLGFTESVQLVFMPGWDQDKDLLSILETSYRNDKQRGFTYYGPQRADLSLKIKGKPVRDICSRGQKKLITYAMYLSQALLQESLGSRTGVLLIDDLPSELDANHQQSVISFLEQLPMQSVLSCIDAEQLSSQSNKIAKRFHVEQGRVTEVL